MPGLPGRDEGRRGLVRSVPPMRPKSTDAAPHDDESLCHEQPSLLCLVAAEPTERPTRTDDPVTGDIRRATGGHDRAHGPCCAGTSRGVRHVAVGRHPSAGDGPDGGQNAPRELRR